MGNECEQDYLSGELHRRAAATIVAGGGEGGERGEDGDDESPPSKRARSNAPVISIGPNAATECDADGVHDDDDDDGAVVVVVHSPKCNVGRTHDGIRAGGRRLANEIVEYVESDVRDRLLLSSSSPPMRRRYDDEYDGDRRHGGDGTTDDEEEDDVVVHATYSIVGNSLGGLYGRYAISLLPYTWTVSTSSSSSSLSSSSDSVHRSGRRKTAAVRLHLHPNVFCTTATPHLGVSRHTYLPIPRMLETIIGTGMRTTGRDLFRLGGKSLSSSSSSSMMSLASLMRGKRRMPSSRNVDDNVDGGRDSNANGDTIGDDGIVVVETSGRIKDDDDIDNIGDDGCDDVEEVECVIRSMCLGDRYLDPLRNFRSRIAYANAYGTDFQVPTMTAAFLNDRSVVPHRLVANRVGVVGIPPDDVVGGGGSGGGTSRNDDGGRDTTVPSFVVAVCRTEVQLSATSSMGMESSSDGVGGDVLDDDLLLMSQSLDSLGWTKVFIDVRDYLPVAGMSTPTWLRSSYGTLDELIRERTRMDPRGIAMSDDVVDGRLGRGGGDATTDTTAGCILTSQELARSTHVSDSMDLPLGHAVMVANSKNERYSQFNSAGRPVMDKLAKDIIDDILKFQ